MLGEIFIKIFVTSLILTNHTHIYLRNVCVNLYFPAYVLILVNSEVKMGDYCKINIIIKKPYQNELTTIVAHEQSPFFRKVDWKP